MDADVRACVESLLRLSTIEDDPAVSRDV